MLLLTLIALVILSRALTRKIFIISLTSTLMLCCVIAYNINNYLQLYITDPRAIHDEKILQQEGWHYDITSAGDPLKYKGVVYNEMKGVYSSPDSLLYKHSQELLFPQTTYGVDSGGDPISIPQLSFPQMQAFHRKYYHPGNARVFFYGDDNVAKRLEVGTIEIICCKMFRFWISILENTVVMRKPLLWHINLPFLHKLKSRIFLQVCPHTGN